MERLQELKDLVATFEKDFVKFYEKGNKSAGTRVRKHMNELKRKAQEIYDTMTRVYTIAARDGIPSYQAADRLAEERISSVAALKRMWVAGDR